MAAAGGRIAPFLHVCLQSGCDATLGRMARVYRSADFRRVVATARELLPHVAIGTDLIVGFPGETDADFGESLAFCREMRFSRMHVFRYSRRPGTPAATMGGQVIASWPTRAARYGSAHTVMCRGGQRGSWAPTTSSSCRRAEAGASPAGSSTRSSTRRPSRSLVPVRVTGVADDGATLLTGPRE